MAHTHYKGTGKVHSFRGQIESDGEQDKISIQGSVGSIAWRITKLQAVTDQPSAYDIEGTLKIFREKQTSASATIDFNNDELLAVSYNTFGNQPYEPTNIVTIFDNAIFVRNVYITYIDNGGSSRPMNYYIELEEVKVGKAGMAQLAVAAARRMID
jgi:hypothetical protein